MSELRYTVYGEHGVVNGKEEDVFVDDFNKLKQRIDKMFEFDSNTLSLVLDSGKGFARYQFSLVPVLEDDTLYCNLDIDIDDKHLKTYSREFSFPPTEDEKQFIYDYFSNIVAQLSAKTPFVNVDGFEDETNYSLFALAQEEQTDIFREAYKHARESKSIYKAFSFKHLSDVTQYYVHPNNQSYKGTTSLCQSIGESIVLFSQLYNYIMGKNTENIVSGKCFKADYGEREDFFVEIEIPEAWRSAKVFDHYIYSFKACCLDNNICCAAYDKEGNFIKGKTNKLNEYYKLLQCFMVLLINESETNSDFKKMLFDYCENPTVELFVNLHEDFYQNHKDDEYSITYMNLDAMDTEAEEMICLDNAIKVIAENKRQKDKEIKDMKTIRFENNSFKTEYMNLVPELPKEFQMDKKLLPVCNAVVNGDARAVLLHGPAGTGKTIGCKLICQAANLPLMQAVNCTENLDEFVLGKYIPKDDRIIFSESYVTKAIRDGGAVVFEEINFARPQYLAFLNSLLDDNGFVRLDNGELVKRHQNFRFFATMNMGYFGTKELNQALFNRFNAIVELTELSDNAIKDMLIVRSPESERFCDNMISVYHKIKNKIQADEMDFVISPRNLENWARMAKYQGYINAAESTIIPIAKGDRAFERTMRSLIEMYAWH